MSKIFSYFLVNFTEDNVKAFFSRDNVGNIAAQIIIVFVFWGSLWGLCGEPALPPNGYLFNILMVVVLAHLLGKLFQLWNLPPLIGMLVIGFILNNRNELGAEELNLRQDYGSPVVDGVEAPGEKLIRVLRHVALVIVLIRAGLEMDTNNFNKIKAVFLRLAFMPCIVETVTIALTSYYLLGFEMQWGFLMGFMLSAVSPAVIIPPILAFKRHGLGMDKGIPTLLILSASFDDIVSIVGYGLCLKLIFTELTELNIAYILLRIPADPLIGVMTGIFIGMILWYVPSADSSEPQKLCLLVFAGLAAQFVFTSSDMRAAGPEACFVVAVVASHRWRNDKSLHRIENDLKDFWAIFQAILFGLIGTDVRIADLKDERILLGFLCVLIGVLMRFLTAFCVTFGERFTMKERIFIGFAWLPKATLQVAMSPIILEMTKNSTQKNVKQARLVVDITFLAVILTAPLGAIAINILGPQILNKTSEEKTISPKTQNKLNFVSI